MGRGEIGNVAGKRVKGEGRANPTARVADEASCSFPALATVHSFNRSGLPVSLSRNAVTACKASRAKQFVYRYLAGKGQSSFPRANNESIEGRAKRRSWSEKGKRNANKQSIKSPMSDNPSALVSLLRPYQIPQEKAR